MRSIRSEKGQSKPKAQILVVDDHPMIRGGLIRLISQQSDLECCGEAGTVAEAEAAIARQYPDLMILDFLLKSGASLDFIKSLKRRFPEFRILILSQYDAPLYVERTLHAGALGYVAKEHAPDEIITAIRTVLNGQVYLTRAMSARLLLNFVGQCPKNPSGVEALTDRELQVLQLLGAGMGTREIAHALSLSFKTVETHRENMKRKLGLSSAPQLVHYAAEWARQQVSLPPDAIRKPASPRQ